MKKGLYENMIIKYLQRLKSKKGFTMVELMICIGIFAILIAAMAMLFNPVNAIIQSTRRNARVDGVLETIGSYIKVNTDTTSRIEIMDWATFHKPLFITEADDFLANFSEGDMKAHLLYLNGQGVLFDFGDISETDTLIELLTHMATMLSGNAPAIVFPPKYYNLRCGGNVCGDCDKVLDCGLPYRRCGNPSPPCGGACAGLSECDTLVCPAFPNNTCARTCECGIEFTLEVLKSGGLRISMNAFRDGNRVTQRRVTTFNFMNPLLREVGLNYGLDGDISGIGMSIDQDNGILIFYTKYVEPTP
ncbi:MAG: prepilin-type N-terminal cleavage/methylation domain-containing protein [Oscillospiraceae bacterium]|nr:prepilin-type N-terminal cleavage/methylation domain-containing protein [Oscillospiraceae bacterium]